MSSFKCHFCGMVFYDIKGLRVHVKTSNNCKVIQRVQDIRDREFKEQNMNKRGGRKKAVGYCITATDSLSVLKDTLELLPNSRSRDLINNVNRVGASIYANRPNVTGLDGGGWSIGVNEANDGGNETVTIANPSVHLPVGKAKGERKRKRTGSNADTIGKQIQQDQKKRATETLQEMLGLVMEMEAVDEENGYGVGNDGSNEDDCCENGDEAQEEFGSVEEGLAVDSLVHDIQMEDSSEQANDSTSGGDANSPSTYLEDVQRQEEEDMLAERDGE